MKRLEYALVAPSRERTITSRRVYSGEKLNLRVDVVELPNGNRATREIIETTHGVAIIALIRREVLMVRHYRHALGFLGLELPGGGVKPNESPRRAAQRELAEETGFKAKALRKVLDVYPSCGHSNEVTHIFTATQLYQAGEEQPKDELVQVVSIPLERTPALMKKGTIKDAKTIAGLLFFLKSNKRRLIGRHNHKYR